MTKKPRDKITTANFAAGKWVMVFYGFQYFNVKF
jgi:hypothetical protein